MLILLTRERFRFVIARQKSLYVRAVSGDTVATKFSDSLQHEIKGILEDID